MVVVVEEEELNFKFKHGDEEEERGSIKVLKRRAQTVCTPCLS